MHPEENSWNAVAASEKANLWEDQPLYRKSLAEMAVSTTTSPGLGSGPLDSTIPTRPPPHPSLFRTQRELITVVQKTELQNPENQKLSDGKDNTKAGVAPRDVRVDQVAGGSVTVPRIVVPRAATKNLEPSRKRPPRIVNWTVFVIFLIIPIVTPLPHITSHIIQPKLIRRKTPNR